MITGIAPLPRFNADRQFEGNVVDVWTRAMRADTFLQDLLGGGTTCVEFSMDRGLSVRFYVHERARERAEAFAQAILERLRATIPYLDGAVEVSPIYSQKDVFGLTITPKFRVL